MGLFDKVERSLESAVNNVFAKAFKGDVEPVEIASALQKELDSAAQSLSGNRRLVPNVFSVQLAQHDYDRLAPHAQTWNSEIVPGLGEYAASRRYVFAGPISIDYLLDESLTTGRFVVTSSTRAGVTNDRSTLPGEHGLVLEVNGVRHPLAVPGFTIGRGTEADLRINDPGVSRLHAEVIVEEVPTGGIRVSITDLGSTNGLIINGQKLRSAELSQGSRIEIGSTRLLVHSPAGE